MNTSLNTSSSGLGKNLWSLRRGKGNPQSASALELPYKAEEEESIALKSIQEETDIPSSESTTPSLKGSMKMLYQQQTASGKKIGDPHTPQNLRAKNTHKTPSAVIKPITPSASSHHVLTGNNVVRAPTVQTKPPSPKNSVPPSSEEKFSFTVFSTSTQKNYKILVKTKDANKLKISKIKSNLFRVVNIPVEEQVLYASTSTTEVTAMKPLDDVVTGKMLDLNEKTVLILVHVSQQGLFEEQFKAPEAATKQENNQVTQKADTLNEHVETSIMPADSKLSQSHLQDSPKLIAPVTKPVDSSPIKMETETNITSHEQDILNMSQSFGISFSSSPPNDVFSPLKGKSEKELTDRDQIVKKSLEKHFNNQISEEKIKLSRKFASEKKEILQKANQDRQELMTENTRLRKELLTLTNEIEGMQKKAAKPTVPVIQQVDESKFKQTINDLKAQIKDKEKHLEKAAEEMQRMKEDYETESQVWQNRMEMERQVLWNREKDVILRNWAEEIEILKLVQQQERLEVKNIIDQMETEIDIANQKIENDKRFVDSANLALENLKNQITKLLAGDTDSSTIIMEAAKEKALIEKQFKNLSNDYYLLRELMDEEVKKRKALHNLVEDMKGNIRVCVRLRPLLEDEQLTDFSQGRIDIKDETTLLMTSQNLGVKNFEFYRVLDENATQEDVFDHVKPLLQSAIDGFNLCIFAYGQTGSGKTFTIHGDAIGSQQGLIPRTADYIFKTLEKQICTRSESFNISCSMVELYLDNLIDLFEQYQDNQETFVTPQHRFSSQQSLQKKKPQLRQSKNGKMSVTNCVEVDVNNTMQLLELLEFGNESKQVFKTDMNDQSSRSHTIFTIKITIQGSTQPNSSNPQGRQYKREAKIALVDLAGSERVSRSNSTGDRFKETQHINKSLSALGDVIAALSTHQKHIPYRNSKLTLMLQDMIGGNSKTLMFANISPDRRSLSETISTLSFASRVKCVQNHPMLSNQTEEIE